VIEGCRCTHGVASVLRSLISRDFDCRVSRAREHRGELRTRAQVELAEDAAEMRLDGAEGDEQRS
jgi:hypothetical protein